MGTVTCVQNGHGILRSKWARYPVDDGVQSRPPVDGEVKSARLVRPTGAYLVLDDQRLGEEVERLGEPAADGRVFGARLEH